MSATPRTRRLAIAALALGIATSGMSGTAFAAGHSTAISKPKPAPAPATKVDQHPASEGWVNIKGTWVQTGATRPHVMPNAKTFAAKQTALGATAKAAATPNVAAAPRNNYDLQMTYRGGQDSIGVTTGQPKVYLIYWGKQWGVKGTDPATGNLTLSGDPDGAAPYQQDFFKGLGSSTDTWSKVMTQYCEGIASGASRCPAGANHVGMPVAGQTLAGVWVDDSAAAPTAATEPQIAAEALAAAQHFGNTEPNQNRNVQYIINSPQGTDPDKWQELGYCAWHTFERGAYGTMPYTIMPYLTDNKYCGTNWINPGARGRLDGYGIIGGHEYAETISDQNPSGAWTDATGQENGDKCAWIPQGSNGGLFNLQLSTGTFPVQTTWSNYDHACVGDDPVFANSPLLVTRPCDQTSPLGKPMDYAVLASDTAGRKITYSATGLPAGLSINASTGHITGTSNASGWQGITVTGSDDLGNKQSQFFWYGFFATGQFGCTAAIEQLNDSGFENGTADHGVWNASGYNIITPSSAHDPHTGNAYAWLGQNTATDDSVIQWVETTPGYSKEFFSFWLNITGTATGSSAPTGSAVDSLSLVLYDQYTGNQMATVRTWTNLNATNGYQQQSFDLTPYVASEFGSTVGLKLVSHSTTGNTAFLIDDASVKLY